MHNNVVDYDCIGGIVVIKDMMIIVMMVKMMAVMPLIKNWFILLLRIIRCVRFGRKLLLHLQILSNLYTLLNPLTVFQIVSDLILFQMEMWIDGFDILLGREMSSNKAKSDLEYLLGIEVSIHLLDTANLVIPHIDPVVPEPPEDFNFCTDWKVRPINRMRKYVDEI